LRDNPNPHLPEEKQVFKGLNAIRNTGDTIKLYQQELFAWEHAEKNNLELNSVALPTLTEKTFKAIKQKKEQ
jgi:pre-mRNA-processing factor SLU7